MKLKNIIIGFGIILLFIPVFINAGLYLSCFITPEGISNKDWLSFWGSYIGGATGGIGTLMAVYFTIKYYEDQNDKNRKLLSNSENIIRINIILEKIADRDPIPNSTFSYNILFNDFREMIETYNSLQGHLVSYFTNNAMGIFLRLFYVTDDNGEELENNLSNYFRIPNDVKEYSFIVGKLALYENCSELIKGDPRIGHIIEKEAGGSYGMWHRYIHQFSEDDIMQDSLKEFFNLIPKLIQHLELLKNKLSY